MLSADLLHPLIQSQDNRTDTILKAITILNCARRSHKETSTEQTNRYKTAPMMYPYPEGKVAPDNWTHAAGTICFTPRLIQSYIAYNHPWS